MSYDDNQNLEPAADEMLRSGKKVADGVSLTPALYSIAISMKRIADELEVIRKIAGLK